MNGLMESDRRFGHHGRRCQSKPKKSRPRHLHQSTLSLGDTAPCYITTHKQSYSGRSADGRPLVFQLREPSFPSQHQTRLDLSDDTTLLLLPLLPLLQSHSKEVHGPKRITPRTDPKVENWARYRSGQAVREITNPAVPSDHLTAYETERPVAEGSPQRASGRPTQWHQHDILTGEQRQTAGPGRPSRRSRDKLLWAARRWETDCCALRLY